MTYTRPFQIAISGEARTMLQWRAKAENKDRDGLDRAVSVDSIADEIILEWFERHMPQLKHKLALRQQLDEEAVAEAQKALSNGTLLAQNVDLV